MAGQTTSVKILSGASSSAAIYLGELTLVGVDCPTTDAGSLSLQVSSDGGTTFRTFVTDSTGNGTNGAYTILPASSTGNVYVGIDVTYMYGADVIKLVDGASQSADRTFTLHLREVR